MKKICYTLLFVFCITPSLMAAEKASGNSYGNFSIYAEQNFFSWEDDDKNKGYQHVTPLTLTYQYKSFHLGLRRAFIYSKNNSPGHQGKVSDWSDTSVSAACVLNSSSAFPIRLNLSMNIPNGKATLSGDEKNAIMDGHLVWQTRFGEGFNLTPGLTVSYSFTEKDTVGFGLSKIFRGSFDPNGDVENDKIDPGDNVIATLNYSHIASRWMVNAGFTYQHSEKTTRDKKDYYKKGDLWSLDLGGAVSFLSKHSLAANYRFSYRKKDHYINNLTGSLEEENFNSNGAIHFVNFDYGYHINEKHCIHLIGDYLKVGNNDYDEINFLYLPAREKWALGVRYDWDITQKVSLSTIIKGFNISDEATPFDPDGKEYDGWNAYLSLKYNF